MGMFQKGLDKAHARQKKSVIEEAGKAGATVVDVVEMGNEETSAAESAIGSTLKSLFGGKVSRDYVQLFRLTTAGINHIYVQPYDGISPVPGEHHAQIAGSWRSPLILEKRLLGGGKWKADDTELAAELSKDKSLKRVTSQLKWEWATGTTKIKLPWAVQIRAVPNGSSHLVMKAGRYGGFTSYKVGVQAFAALCQQFGASGSSASQPTQSFITDTEFAPVFEQVLL